MTMKNNRPRRARHCRHPPEPIHRAAGREDAKLKERVEIKVTDPETGAEESYGHVVDRLQAGTYRLILARDDDRRMRWILVDRPDDLLTIGYRPEREPDCAAAWEALTRNSRLPEPELAIDACIDGMGGPVN